MQEISTEQTVPLNTFYRRARDLVDQGLPVTERIVVTADGKRYAVFRSCFKSVGIASGLGDVSLSVELNGEVADKLRQKLFCISHRDGGS